MSTEPTPQQPSGEIQQVLGGNKNQAIAEMSGGTAFSTVEGSVSIIYNYYYHREPVDSEFVESTDTTNDENLPCPYCGLFHFSPNDAPYFFGREVFIEELFAATQTRNFIPVLGASGSGKSSVVLAGLVPKLQKEGHWLFTHFRPGSDPFHALALALVPLYTKNLDDTDKIIQARKLAQSLGDGEILLADVFAQIHQNHPTDRVLLIADQFEEVYTLCTDQKICCSFLDVLLASLQSSPSYYNHVLVTTMRVDFLGNALSYPQFGEMLRNTDIKVRSMNREELTQAIKKPADRLGVTFQDGLIERILNDIGFQPGNLPLLEFALTLLWDKLTNKQLTHVAYEVIGKVQGALAIHAEKVYNTLNSTEKQQIRLIYIQLVSISEYIEDTRKLVKKVDLDEEEWSLVQKLANARLLITNVNEAGQETVEIVHETLIIHWSRLRNWINENRVKLKQKQKIEYAAKWWLNKGMPTPSAYLLEGSELTEAKNFLQTYAKTLPLSNLAKKFVQKSISQERNKRNFSVMVVSSLALLASIISAIKPFSWFLETQAISTFLRLRGSVTPPEEIVILAIDNESLSAPKQSYKTEPQKYAYLEPLTSYPFQRKAYGEAIKKLIQAGARHVAIGLLFDSSNNYGKADDKQLIEALERYGDKVTLAASYERSDANGGYSWTLVRPHQQFRTGSVSIGFANFPLEIDGKIHRLSSVFPEQIAQQDGIVLSPIPSFNQSVLLAAGIKYPQPKGDRIHFYGGAKTFKTYSFWNLFEPAFWDTNLESGKVFQNKIVIIGVTASSTSNDFYVVGTGRNWLSPERMSGVEIHANAIATLMNGKAINQATESSTQQVLFVLVLVGSTAIIVTRSKRGINSFMFCIALASIWAGIAYVSFVYCQIILPTTIPVVAIVLIAIFSLRRR